MSEQQTIEYKSSMHDEYLDYIRHTNRADNFKVALTHASLNTKPVREVHGGCTPEEISVNLLGVIPSIFLPSPLFCISFVVNMCCQYVRGDGKSDGR